jgi:hypothetical protein
MSIVEGVCKSAFAVMVTASFESVATATNLLLPIVYQRVLGNRHLHCDYIYSVSLLRPSLLPSSAVSTNIPIRM